MSACDGRAIRFELACSNLEHRAAYQLAWDSYHSVIDDGGFILQSWSVVHAVAFFAHPWDWVGAHELTMLHGAGVTNGDIQVGIDRWQSSTRVLSDWGFVRAVAWNEALKRREILAGIEHGAADRQRA